MDGWIDLHLGSGPLSPDAPRPWLGRALCAPYRIMGAAQPYYSSRWPPSLNSQYLPAPRKRSPGTHVWVRPKPRIHIECEPRFPLTPRTSYTRGCHAALVGRDISSGCLMYYIWTWGLCRAVVVWTLLHLGDSSLLCYQYQNAGICSVKRNIYC